jgi:amylosucrase
MPEDIADRQADITRARLRPRIEAVFAPGAPAGEWAAFEVRLGRYFPRLFRLLMALYGSQYDFYYHLEQILSMAARMWLERSADLKALDAEREAEPRWFQSEKMVGGVCYVDLFAGDLKGLRDKIPYFKQLGLTYLHLMPLFKAPEGNSDGGYAVSSYREVEPGLGTIEELSELAGELRHNGISLVLDFVFNHTSDEHDWAKQAQAADLVYSDYYYIFPDRVLPDAYERTLREIFPDQRPGSFTYRPDMGKWIWTTFNSFQWDLNYSNPAVFTGMAEEMLQLANRGAEILRLDALAFVWKEMGTDCENRPEAHLLIQAFNTVARIAAPALLFKSEAIVHPDRVVEYIGEDECQLSYNPLLMALLWEALATREVGLLALSMREKFTIGDCCAWVNYVRSHDDIGWTFDDSAAAHLGIDGYGHRRFLNDFYTGRFNGSFARGLPFGENPRTGDARISGTCASLAGLEAAILSHDPDMVQLAIGRILLLYSVVASIGGIPLIYLGDEVGTLNDYSYRDDPAKAGDSRWVHRPATNWARMDKAQNGQIYREMLHLLDVRRATPAFADGGMEVVGTGNPHVFSFVRHHEAGRVLVFANFSEHEQVISANEVRLYGLGYSFREIVTGENLRLEDDIHLAPYRFMWLAPE